MESLCRRLSSSSIEELRHQPDGAGRSTRGWSLRIYDVARLQLDTACTALEPPSARSVARHSKFLQVHCVLKNKLRVRSAVSSMPALGAHWQRQPTPQHLNTMVASGLSSVFAPCLWINVSFHSGNSTLQYTSHIYSACSPGHWPASINFIHCTMRIDLATCLPLHTPLHAASRHFDLFTLAPPIEPARQTQSRVLLTLDQRFSHAIFLRRRNAQFVCPSNFDFATDHAYSLSST